MRNRSRTPPVLLSVVGALSAYAGVALLAGEEPSDVSIWPAVPYAVVGAFAGVVLVLAIEAILKRSRN